MVPDVVGHGEPISRRHAPSHRLGPSRQRKGDCYGANGGGRHVVAVERLPALRRSAALRVGFGW